MLHQVGDLFELYDDARTYKPKITSYQVYHVLSLKPDTGSFSGIQAVKKR